MLSVKEKRKEGMNYVFRILVLSLNIFILQLVFHMMLWVSQVLKDGMLDKAVNLMNQYFYFASEQMQGLLNMVWGVLGMAGIAVSLLFFYLLFRKMPERKQVQILMKNLGYRLRSIIWYEFCYLFLDILIPFIVSFMLFPQIVQYFNHIKMMEILEIQFVIDKNIFLISGVVCLLIAFCGTGIKVKNTMDIDSLVSKRL